MIDSIDEYGELKQTKSKHLWFGRSAKTVDDWVIELPESDKYLKYEVLVDSVDKIRFYRKIIGYAALVILVCGTPLFALFY